jgi:hypothetical protein
MRVSSITFYALREALIPTTLALPKRAAGETILQLIHRAAGVAEENSRHAVEIAQKLSHQLRASEDRIAELEAEAATYRERAERAEQWLRRIYSEIDNRFLRQRREDGRPRSDLN